VVGKITVYVCQEPAHEELIETLKSVVDSIKGKKPKIKVVRLKLRSSEDFPYYLKTLEELYGGIATAEYRKYGVRSLPAIVYNGRAILQGKVPTREEIEEALAFEGLKVVRKTPAVQPAPQLATQVVQPKRPAEVPRIELRIKDVPPASRASPRATELQRPTSEAPAPAIAQRFEQPLAKPATQSASEPIRREPERAIPQPAPPPKREAAAARFPPVEVEEVSVEARAETARAAQARPITGKRCDECIFYERGTMRCLLYRVPVADPSKPPCSRRP
jgi:hypothetical protein